MLPQVIGLLNPDQVSSADVMENDPMENSTGDELPENENCAGNELQEHTDADIVGLNKMTPDVVRLGEQDENGNDTQTTTPSTLTSTARLQPPASGQFPGRCLSALAPKVGRGRGKVARIATTVVRSGSRPASAATGKRPAAVRVRPTAQALNSRR